MKYFFIGLLIPAIVMGSAGGQTAVSSASVQAQLSPVPPYPADGVIPSALKDQYIFRDLKTGEIVFSYPSEMSVAYVKS